MAIKLNSIIHIMLLILSSTGCAHGQDVRTKLDSYVSAFADQEKFSGSVLVAQKGRVLLNKGYRKANYERDIPNTPQTKFKIASITKQFTAMAIMQLQEKGLLSVQDYLSKHLPGYPNGEIITIHHLLTHRSGIPDYCAFSNFPEEKIKPHTLLQLIELFKDRPLEFQPGIQYKYSNSGYVLLAYIIEKSSGKNYESFLKENIFDKIGMLDSGNGASSGTLKNLASGYKVGDIMLPADDVDMSFVVGTGSLYSSVEDLYKWDQALYSDVLLKIFSLKKTFTPHYAPADSLSASGYGYGWNIHQVHNRNVVSHLGGIEGFSSLIHRYPDEKICIIILGNIENIDRFRIANGLAAILLGKEYRLPIKHATVTIDPTIYDKYVGKYKFDDGLILQIYKNIDRLYTGPNEQHITEVFPKSETDYFYKMSEVQISFTNDKFGQTTGLTLRDQQDNYAKKIE